MCLVVLGRHVERLKFLDIMFGDRPALTPPQIFYHRMLANDPAEAIAQAEKFIKERPMAFYFDEIALKASRAEMSRRSGFRASRKPFARFVSISESLTISRRRRLRSPRPIPKLFQPLQPQIRPLTRSCRRGC